ncbi:hypothetical protein [Streptomyces sp. 2231.1]|uniref:hypothetical protein n=1 Tax=Streptomyces sp. 2231.1 TaxID=1855347 RepID=UPI00115FCAB5|nr:hypothetical protein [Streptomyces sp. 2231.1]
MDKDSVSRIAIAAVLVLLWSWLLAANWFARRKQERGRDNLFVAEAPLSWPFPGSLRLYMLLPLYVEPMQVRRSALRERVLSADRARHPG